MCLWPGGVSKLDLRRLLQWGAKNLGYPELANIEAAPPTAELEPIRDGTDAQNDEQDMDMTYQVGNEQKSGDTLCLTPCEWFPKAMGCC